MNYVPLNKNIVVVIDDKSETTVGGLYIPENSTKAKLTGKVLAVGETVEHVTVGDRVLVTFKEAYPTEQDGVWIFPYESVLAIVK